MRKILLFVLSVMLIASGCSRMITGELNDGYFTAEASDYNADGWKEYVTIYVQNGKIVTVEYEAKNSSGLLLAWDMDYIRKIKNETGNFPVQNMRKYAAALLNKQDPSKVAVIEGTVDLHRSFQSLAIAAVECAKTGDKGVAFVTT